MALSQSFAFTKGSTRMPKLAHRIAVLFALASSLAWAAALAPQLRAQQTASQALQSTKNAIHDALAHVVTPVPILRPWVAEADDGLGHLLLLVAGLLALVNVLRDEVRLEVRNRTETRTRRHSSWASGP